MEHQVPGEVLRLQSNWVMQLWRHDPIAKQPGRQLDAGSLSMLQKLFSKTWPVGKKRRLELERPRRIFAKD